MIVIKIFDIVASILILVGIWIAPKNKKGWLIYASGTIFFLVVTISKGLPGLSLMGVATLITSVRNFLVKKKE